MFSEQQKVAFLRGAASAVGTGAATFLAALAAGEDYRKAAIGAGIAALAVLGFRSGEGALDTGRALAALKGDQTAIHPSDVGAYSPPIAPAPAPVEHPQ